MKRTIPFVIASIAGFVLIAAHFIPYAKDWSDQTTYWFDILAGFAFLIGGGNLLKMNLQKISDRRAGWGFSAVTVLAFLVTLGIGLTKAGTLPSENFPAHPWAAPYLQEGGAFWWIFYYVFFPLSAMMFAMLAFYIASAAFRAFRAKNTEATILLVVAFIILMGNTYGGIFLTDWIPEKMPKGWEWVSGLRVENLKDTILTVFNLAGNRAIMIGIALGVVSTSLKVLLGVDRSYLGSD